MKRERSSRKISLEDLSKGTRISRSYLEALERDDFGFSSRHDFILGFLKGYARHLGLEPDEVLRRYRIQTEVAGKRENFRQMPLFSRPAGMTEEEEAEPPQRAVPQKKRRKIPWKILFQVAVLLAALGLSFYIHRLMK